MNRSFYISLLVFILLMCSCKSKKIVSDISTDVKHVSNISYLNETVKIDTSKTAYFANEIQSIVIEEDITVIEYDKESGKPIKETNAKRKTTQDSEKASAKEVQNRVESHSRDSLNHFREVTKKVESEVKEEVKGGQEAFGKWLGIIIGTGVIIGLFILIVYLWNKFRVD